MHDDAEIKPPVGGALQAAVIEIEPPSLLEFRWGTDVIRLEIEKRAGGCTLTLLDTIDEIGKAARDSAGWHECLDLLAFHLDGQQPAWGHGERWAQVHPGYVASFGPEASAIGAPPGFEAAASDQSQGRG